MSKGKFIISLDFELMWGLAGHDADYLRSYAENVKNAPEAIKHIIAICSKYGVKLTIAHVGAIAQRQHSDIHPITPPICNQHITNRSFSQAASRKLRLILPAEMIYFVARNCCNV